MKTIAWKAGDVVRIKSVGGVPMTVETPTITEVWCVWFDGFERLQRGSFPPEGLERCKGR